MDGPWKRFSFGSWINTLLVPMHKTSCLFVLDRTWAGFSVSFFKTNKLRPSRLSPYVSLWDEPAGQVGDEAPLASTDKR